MRINDVDADDKRRPERERDECDDIWAAIGARRESRHIRFHPIWMTLAAERRVSLARMFGIVTCARRVQVRLKALAQLNLELAKIEGKRRAIALGIAVGLAVAAAVLVFYAVGFLFASAVVALNADLALWLSLLVVAGAIIVVAVIAAVVAMSFAKKLSSPSSAVDEVERTVRTLQAHA